MQRQELRALLTPEGLSLQDELAAIVGIPDAAREISRLRSAGHSPDLVSAVVGQAVLRHRARRKFGDFADRMLFTKAGLEQATRLPVAAYHARRMREAGVSSVADLGCGIGGDAIGFAGAGLSVLAADADEVTAEIAAYNLAPFGDAVTVVHAKAQQVSLSDSDAVWLDPARRMAGHSETRRVRSDDYSPSLDWAFETASRLPTGIKLGPGHNRTALPPDAEAQWVSVDGDVVELLLWSGSLVRGNTRRAALVMRSDTMHELRSPTDAPDSDVRELGAFVHEPDGAVIRARLIGDVARMLNAGILDPQIAYLTGDADKTNPFVRSFRVRETLPFGTKPLAAALRARNIGTLEIKKRGVDVDPAALRRSLKLRGDESATLLLTRIGTQRVAILADRVSD